MVSQRNLNIIERLKEDIKKFSEGSLEYLPTGKQYSQEYEINERAILEVFESQKEVNKGNKGTAAKTDVDEV